MPLKDQLNDREYRKFREIAGDHAVAVTVVGSANDPTSHSNPIPVSTNYEKILEVIKTSRWLDDAVVDEVVFSSNPDRTAITASFYEDDGLLGEAVITYTSDLSWSFQLSRYLLDDDNTQLQDDDGSFLNLG